MLDAFRHCLPAERLGRCHSSLHQFQETIDHHEIRKTKEYSLVMVTEPENQRILLGRKHRGFGKGMFNSFGGKLDLGESALDSAVRELEEETGIVVPAAHLGERKVGSMNFSFEDSDTAMLVHVYRLNVSCGQQQQQPQQPSSLSDERYFGIDPNQIRPCDEITPQWFDNWYDVPLHNMFADDSLWLTKVLDSTHDIEIDGHFHFEPGGQDVNSIRHYFMDVRTKG